MKFGGICIETDNAPRLAEFYKIVFQEEPFVEGSHYGFGKIAVYDPGCKAEQEAELPTRPGNVTVAKDKNIWLQCFVEDLDEDVGFFLIEIELWKIGNSLPAPRFNVVEKPNDWAKAMKVVEGLSDTKKVQFEFWQAFKSNHYILIEHLI